MPGANQKSVSLPDQVEADFEVVAKFMDIPPATLKRNALLVWWQSEEFSLLLKRAKEEQGKGNEAN